MAAASCASRQFFFEHLLLCVTPMDAAAWKIAEGAHCSLTCLNFLYDVDIRRECPEYVCPNRFLPVLPTKALCAHHIDPADTATWKTECGLRAPMTFAKKRSSLNFSISFATSKQKEVISANCVLRLLLRIFLGVDGVSTQRRSV